MPRKRRASKHRDLRAEYETWQSIFDCGFDFFGELPALGVPTDAYGRPERDHAKVAWRRHGGAFLESHRPEGTIWALEQFGEPHAC